MLGLNSKQMMKGILILLILASSIWHCLSEEIDYELVDADVRNIIFVGRSRSGKTTLIDVLKNVSHVPSDMQLFRGTKTASLATFTMESKKENKNLHFNIMDTPGLYEIELDVNDKRTNEVILDIIKKCIDLEITKIHHVYFVMSISQGLNTQDLKSFKTFSDLFVGLQNKISVIISWAQTFTDKAVEHFKNEFKTVPDLKVMYDIVNGRIYFLGAAEESDVYDMKLIRANVARQRAKIFEHIINQSEPYNVKQLKIYKDNLSLITRVKKTLDECCKTKTCPDLKKFDSFIEHYSPEPLSKDKKTEL